MIILPKYHISADGTPGVCHAHKGRCPLGGVSGEENHFDTKAEAQAAIDEQHMNSFTDASREHAIMQNVDWNKFEPNTQYNGIQRMTIDEDLSRLNDKYINNNLHIAGDPVRMRAFMNTTNEVGKTISKKEIKHILEERSEVFHEYKNTPQLTSLENSSFDEYKSAVQDWTYAKMNYERDGDIHHNSDLDRKHFDEVDWDNATLNDSIDETTAKERDAQLGSFAHNEDRDPYIQSYFKVRDANTIEEVNNAIWERDGDGTIGEAYLNTRGHDAADFYRDSHQFNKYKSSVSDFLYTSANKI